MQINQSSIIFVLIFAVVFSYSQEQKKGTVLESTTETGEKINSITKKNTAQPNVVVLPEKFEITDLDRSRTIRIYLPPSYETSNKKYPVLYMHDAQNLFDDATSYAGEWQVDEILNKLAQDDVLELIVVGIDNGSEKRMNELSPWKNKEFGQPEGRQYINFIIRQIKPYIDSNYRTLKDKNNTAIMGSSMGGLISHYAIYQYPDIFGKAGIFSPSYWFSEEVFSFTKSNSVPGDTRLFMLVGNKEGKGMAKNTKKMYDQILSISHPKENIKAIIDPNGEHNEAFWSKHFEEAVRWLFNK